MKQNDVQRFLGEIVGYRKLGELISIGILKDILEDRIPEDAKQEILVSLDETILGTRELEVEHPQEEVVYRAELKMPKTVPLEKVRGYQEDVCLGDLDLTAEERHTTEIYDLAVPVETPESKRHERFLRDQGVDTFDDSLTPVRGIPEGATNVIWDFDQMFTTWGVFVDYDKGIDSRGEKAEAFLKEIMGKTFPDGSYSVTRIIERDRKTDFSRGYGEVVVVNGKGYSLVFRPFGNIPFFSATGKTENYPAGTMIYLDGSGVDVSRINKLVKRYSELLESARKEIK